MTATLTDGALPLALQRLEDAADDLAQPQRHRIEQQHPGSRRTRRRTIETPSRYEQLAVAIFTHGTSHHHAGAASKIPLWPAAFDLRADIDLTLRDWQPGYRLSTHPTIDRLTTFVGRRWRPQDVGEITAATDTLIRFSADIDNLLDPPFGVDLPHRCPACRSATAQRRRDGENITTTALHLTFEACRCRVCKAVWSPDTFAHLGRVLGTYVSPTC